MTASGSVIDRQIECGKGGEAMVSKRWCFVVFGTEKGNPVHQMIKGPYSRKEHPGSERSRHANGENKSKKKRKKKFKRRKRIIPIGHIHHLLVVRIRIIVRRYRFGPFEDTVVTDNRGAPLLPLDMVPILGIPRPARPLPLLGLPPPCQDANPPKP